MNKMAIIADDLTGASDAGVQLARKGIATRVVFDLRRLVSGTGETAAAESLVIDTDSRAVSAAEAYRRVKEAAARLRQLGFAHLNKKIDSTLHGNLGAEIDGVLDAFPFDFAAVAPAFPKIGRTTVNGHHYLRGQPIHQTEIGRDPKSPVHQSDVSVLLNTQSKRKSGSIGLDVLRAGKQAVLERLQSLLASGMELVVFDAETDTDLERIAELAETEHRILWVGSAGLADRLPARLGLPVGERRPLVIPPATKPVLLVEGSTSSITREQVGVFCQQPDVTAVEMNPLPVVQGGSAAGAEIDRCRSELLAAIGQGKDAALYAGSAPGQVAAANALGEKLGLDRTQISDRIADALGAAAAQAIENSELQGVILTGGDTAKAVCKQLGVTGLELLQELEPGVPISRLAGQRSILTVTKAGAFGTKETLLHARSVLKGVD
ncbi:MAG: four-carbon acid sugar kinase family protein [Hydrogenibacillus sp.]|nr:four-carbon acid sugar kinase family protein [Hydrogenibacillus sp.]